MILQLEKVWRSNMKRILVGFIMDGHGGGIDKYLLNFLENVRGENVKIDFLTNEIDSQLERYLKKRGAGIFAIANLRHPIKQYKQICRIIEKGHYDIVYLNISTAIDCIGAWAARRMKVGRIMLHSHSSGNDCEHLSKRFIFNLIHRICRLTLYRSATEYYGCSKKAGLWLFPKKIVDSSKFQVIFNSVDMERFYFNPNVRAEVRKEFGLEDSFIVGHVGNFLYSKNHFFLLDIFKAFKSDCPEAVLLLIGTGEKEEAVKSVVKSKGLEDSVKFVGFRKDVDRLYQAMDFFLLPSRFEGLPTVGVEAQSAGLPCLMSDTITDEAKITDRCWFLSLKDDPNRWSQLILEVRDCPRDQIKWIGNREDYSLETLKKQQRNLLDG